MPKTEIITIKKGASTYPELLAQIPDPPKVLYCRGNIELLQSSCLAVVGTRKITPYGREAAVHIAGTLAASGFTVVSGLALGVDAAAHQATLDAGGRTIAVLGTGIDELSPHSNRRLGEQIIASGGLVISEYPPGYPGAKENFPARNRIISGLSHGVVVIEADKASGALITASRAADQGRDVFAVPGNIFSPRSVGPNMLIQKGAKLVLSPQDILEEYAGRQAVLFPAKKENLSTQDPVREKILAILKNNGPTHVDKIISSSGLDVSKIMATVSLLEIHGLIKHIGNGIYKL